MNRAQLMRMGAVLATVPVFSMVEEESARGMESRIDPTLRLVDGHVVVAGPWGTWDTDALSADVVATVVQRTHQATGVTGRYTPNAARWNVRVGNQFQPGAASVHATAVIYLRGGGVEFYDWQAVVTLAR